MGAWLHILFSGGFRGAPELESDMEAPEMIITAPTGESLHLRWCDKGLEIKGVTGPLNIIDKTKPAASHIDVVVGDSNTLYLKPG